MSNVRAFIQGCQSAIPITLGYVPVGIAFGLACVLAGMPSWVAIAMSVFIYAGASQFLLLASITSGASIGAVIGLCALLDSRHLLYAPLIKRHLKRGQNITLSAPLITDEVFATALARLDDVERQTPWFWGVSLVAWLSWWGSTALGVFGGQVLLSYPLMSQVMNFAFVALFVSLATNSFIKHPTHRPAIILAGLSAVLCAVTGFGELAILLASAVAFVVGFVQFKWGKLTKGKSTGATHD